MALQWTKKYEPKQAKDIVGQDEALKQIDGFVQGFAAQKKKALLLHGPSGSGKTSAMYVIAHKYDLEVVEVNASDARNKEQIDLKIKAALGQQSLFSKGKIILIDEIDLKARGNK